MSGVLYTLTAAVCSGISDFEAVQCKIVVYPYKGKFECTNFLPSPPL